LKRVIQKIPEIYDCEIVYDENLVCCILGRSTKDMTKNLVRCKSSNLWAYGIDVPDGQNKVGDVIIQFKGKYGGPGDAYIYYDVPVLVYRKLIGAPSKGHQFWKSIRNKYKYDKLGDKSWRGKLPNAVR
jgi:hypothetical protein